MNAVGQTISGYSSREEVKERMATLPLRDIEGLWQFPSNGTIIALERDDEEGMRFKIVVVDSPFPTLEAGLVLGHAFPTTKRNVLDARLKEIGADGRPQEIDRGKTRQFTLSLTDADAISFVPVKKKLSVNWWRLFPYMSKFRVGYTNDRPKGLDGAVRIWPRSATTPPQQPRYL